VGDTVHYTPIRTAISHIPKTRLLYVNRYTKMGLEGAVDTSTGYGLDGQEIESQWGARFSAPVHAGPGAHPASYTMCKGSLYRR